METFFKDNTVKVMTEDYEITFLDKPDETMLKDTLCGYCLFYEKKIYVLADQEFTIAQIQETLRHELIHAFLFECGLSEWANDEKLVDWLAIQFCKLNELFDKTNAIS